jgi:hypothetical protein
MDNKYERIDCFTCTMSHGLEIDSSMLWLSTPDFGLLRTTNVLLKECNENDRVPTVCSAGDIALSVLIKNPTRVIAVDTNSDQIQLTKAKLWAFQNLNYHEYE